MRYFIFAACTTVLAIAWFWRRRRLQEQRARRVFQPRLARTPTPEFGIYEDEGNMSDAPEEHIDVSLAHINNMLVVQRSDRGCGSSRRGTSEFFTTLQKERNSRTGIAENLLASSWHSWTAPFP